MTIGRRFRDYIYLERERESKSICKQKKVNQPLDKISCDLPGRARGRVQQNLLEIRGILQTHGGRLPFPFLHRVLPADKVLEHDLLAVVSVQLLLPHLER